MKGTTHDKFYSIVYFSKLVVFWEYYIHDNRKDKRLPFLSEVLSPLLEERVVIDPCSYPKPGSVSLWSQVWDLETWYDGVVRVRMTFHTQYIRLRYRRVDSVLGANWQNSVYWLKKNSPWMLKTCTTCHRLNNSEELLTRVSSNKLCKQCTRFM